MSPTLRFSDIRSAHRASGPAGARRLASVAPPRNKFPEALLGLANEDSYLAALDGHHCRTVTLQFSRQSRQEWPRRDQKGFGICLLVFPSLLQKSTSIELANVGAGQWHQSIRKDEATRDIHQRDAIERAFVLGEDRVVVQSKHDPGLVDRELPGSLRICFNAEVQYVRSAAASPRSGMAAAATDCHVRAPRNSTDALPSRIPTIETSSSTAGQWIPSPSPSNSNFASCSGEALASRGNHASGTERTRPSLSDTTSSSLVQRTPTA